MRTVNYFDYQASKKIAGEDYPFYALVMALMRQGRQQEPGQAQAGVAGSLG